MNIEQIASQAAALGYNVSRQDVGGQMQNHNVLNVEAPYAKVASFALKGNELEKSRESLQKVAEASGKDKEKRGAFMLNVFTTLQEMRNGTNENERKTENVSLAEMVRATYGMGLLEFFSAVYGVKRSDTITSMARKMGYDALSVNELYASLRDYSKRTDSFSGMTAREFSNDGHRFVLPEIFLSMMMLGYDSGAKYKNWIGGTESVNASRVTMPYANEGDMMPFFIEEGGAVPYGRLSFGRKDVDLYKVGVAFKITQELLERSSIPLVSLFTSLAGVQMSRGADNLAMHVLISGDQANLSESAPLIGVKNPTVGFQHYDLDYAAGVMDMLGQAPTRAVGRLRDVIRDLNEDKPQRNRETVRAYLGTLGASTDTWYLPEDQIMVIDNKKALLELVDGGLRVDTESHKSTDEESVYIRQRLGFANIKRDARLIIDASQNINAFPLPAYMDMEAHLAEGYRS